MTESHRHDLQTDPKARDDESDTVVVSLAEARRRIEMSRREAAREAVLRRAPHVKKWIRGLAPDTKLKHEP